MVYELKPYGHNITPWCNGMVCAYIYAMPLQQSFEPDADSSRVIAHAPLRKSTVEIYRKYEVGRTQLQCWLLVVSVSGQFIPLLLLTHFDFSQDQAPFIMHPEGLCLCSVGEHLESGWYGAAAGRNCKNVLTMNRNLSNVTYKNSVASEGVLQPAVW